MVDRWSWWSRRGVFRFRRRSPGRSSLTASAPPPSPIDGNWTHADTAGDRQRAGDLFPGSDLPTSAAGSSRRRDWPPLRPTTRGSTRSTSSRGPADFFVVEEAWSERKPEMSRQVMADGLWQQHRVQIQGYVDAHKRNVLEDLAVGNLTVIAGGAPTPITTPSPCGSSPPAPTTTWTTGPAKWSGATSEVGEWSEDWTFQRRPRPRPPRAVGLWLATLPELRGPPRPRPGRGVQVLQGPGQLGRLRLGAGPHLAGARRAGLLSPTRRLLRPGSRPAARPAATLPRGMAQVSIWS